jgi:hypothetical protein
MRSFLDNYFALAFPVFLVVLACSVGFVVAQLSGWSALARRFRTGSAFAGRTWKWNSARLRWMMGYNNCLIIGADATGLYLATMIVIRLGHPPLLVPWHEVSIERRSQTRFVTNVRLSLGREEQIPFVISGKLAAQIQAAAGASWPVETLS